MDLMKPALRITAIKWEPGQSWVGSNGWTSGGRFNSRSRRRQDGFSRRVPVQASSRGSGRRCTLVLMSMAGWYHACLGQSGIRRRAGVLDIRSFLTTALADRAIVFSRGINSMPILCGTGGGGRRGALLVVGGRKNRGPPSSHPRRSAAASVSLLGIQVKNDVTVRQRICSPLMVSTLTKTAAQAHLAPSSSNGFPSSWACWTPQMRLSRERHSSC
jgi:hypothetical protein